MQENDLNLLYQETILDHYKNPRGKKAVAECDHCKNGFNPLCGDKVEVALKLGSGTVEDATVNSTGCAISVASGSMMAELIPGKKIEEVEELAQAFFDMMQGKDFPEELDYGDLDTLEGVRKFHSRVKCATLAWKTLQEIINEWKEKNS